LIESYKKEKGEARIENLEALVNAARSFYFDQDNEENLNELDMFLAHAALEAGDMQGDDY
jgi:DNA helicase-2/ATP-dependent DNA helicase PcrA